MTASEHGSSPIGQEADVGKQETVDQLVSRLKAELPMYGEAKRIMARLMCAGDDGSWAGETNPVKVHIYSIAILAEELQKLTTSTAGR